MALTMDLQFKGIAVPSAYITVVMPVIGIDKETMSFGVNYCASQAEEAFHSYQVGSPYDLEGPNPLEQAYMYLKGLSEFEASTDC